MTGKSFHIFGSYVSFRMFQSTVCSASVKLPIGSFTVHSCKSMFHAARCQNLRGTVAHGNGVAFALSLKAALVV